MANPVHDDSVMQRLEAGDGPAVAWNPYATVDRLIAAHAHLDDVAVVHDGCPTSYRALIELAGRCAELLSEQKVSPGDRIGICADASVELIACMLAVWSAGAVCVPLDPELPQARRDFVVTDVGISLVLVQSAYLSRLSGPVLVIDRKMSDVSRPRASIARPRDTACIVYTSGSTGAPKGVELTHAGLANAILASNRLCSFGRTDRQLFRTSIAFDVALYEILGPLVAGGSVVIARRETWADPRATVALVADAGVTALSASSSFLALLLEEPGFSRCTSVRIVTSGTDAMSAGLCERFFAVSSADLYNGYGPSEATIVVTAHRCVPADMHSHEATVPLGRPLPNTHVSVRDEQLIPVTPGCIGEIVIGGVQLANGYVNRPAETAARFVADPLRPHRRLYRTGDLARLMHDGSIVFLGRNDKQVKVRGQRVEPAEVAAAIERLEGVRTAVVLPRRRDPADPSGSITLVAYIAPRAGAVVRPVKLRSALRMELPDAMVPAEIVIVDTFPLTLTGKIDERALSEREAVVADAPAPVLQTSAESLRGIVHEQVRVLWEEVLGRGGIGDHDDFYDLGGDSLLAVRLTLRLEETFGRAISFADVFTTMTIAGIGEVLSSSSLSEERPATLSNESGSLPPLVFLHGDQAGGMYAWMLAKSLGADQPMLVIPPHGMRGRPPATDVPRMAADVTAIVERFFPAGPIRIAGYSVAGLVAYEAARALTAAGRDVLDVVIIGVGAERVSFAGFSAALRRAGLPARLRNALLRVVMGTALRTERFVRTTPDERWARIGRVLRPKRSNAAANAIDALEQSDAYADYLRTHQTYIPGRFGGRVAILWPDEQPVENGELERDWRRAAPRARIIRVPGTHQKAVSRHIRELAEVMQAVFSEPRADPVAQFLRANGAHRLPHANGRTLLEHLLGTRDILAAWNAPQWLRDAGALHSVYATDVYLRRLISFSRRDEVRAVTSARAERLAYLFAVVRRVPFFETLAQLAPDFPEQLTVAARCPDGSTTATLAREESSLLVLLHMANELEQERGPAGESRPWPARVQRLAALLDADVVTGPNVVLR